MTAADSIIQEVGGTRIDQYSQYVFAADPAFLARLNDDEVVLDRGWRGVQMKTRANSRLLSGA